MGEVVGDAGSHFGGRRAVTCSEWDRRQTEARESATVLRSGQLPLEGVAEYQLLPAAPERVS